MRANLINEGRLLGQRSEAKHLLANQADSFPSASLTARRFAPRQKPLGMPPDLLYFFDGSGIPGGQHLASDVAGISFREVECSPRSRRRGFASRQRQHLAGDVAGISFREVDAHCCRGAGTPHGASLRGTAAIRESDATVASARPSHYVVCQRLHGYRSSHGLGPSVQNGG